MNISPLSAYKH